MKIPAPFKYLSILIFALLIGSTLSSFLPQNKIEEVNMEDCPFITPEGAPLQIRANIEGELFDVYHPFFTKLGYSGNGYCWEGHIVQILEKESPELIQKISFDPEAGGFFAFAKDEESKNEFYEILCPIFSDLKILKKYVKSADRSRIDD